MLERMKLLRKGSGAVCYLLADEEAAALIKGDVTVVQVPVDNWNAQLSPWKATACFKGGEDFAGGAGEYLDELVRAIFAFEKAGGVEPKKRIIAGYSLAGLFALYAAYETDMFSGAVSASGSMWFDGWIDYMRMNRPQPELRCVYLSVGDREKKTRNPRLCTVEDCTREARDILAENGLDAVFVLEQGNHFNEPGARLARGIERIIEMLKTRE